MIILQNVNRCLQVFTFRNKTHCEKVLMDLAIQKKSKKSRSVISLECCPQFELPKY
ncbi:MAG: hypothetical protein AVDCRST_MAG74-765 [uncultured Pyrinomonadaceae bacterium]|uniref:Uncharacterized protein n=1 Tax=uncultured Pyrinomonadaceae bacterium TaxID=2283094 RepID=A0A6J4NJ41_9BACT|nr:MAG: hypothetical protein AVDCRST_MAG74-765 [uncultured Pyrinomonadaceae bacterium]